PAVRALESVRAGEIAQLGLERAGREMGIEPLSDGLRDRQRGIEAQQARQSPVHVDRGMPVVAAVERRVELALIERLAWRLEQVADMPRILAGHIRQRSAGERSRLLFSHSWARCGSRAPRG